LSLDKLIKYINADNIADLLDEEKLREIAGNAKHGYEIDETSCESWIRMNKEALKMIKSDVDTEMTKEYAHSRVVYPLLASAVIQLASRLIPHLVRNNKVVECAVLGPDPEGIKKQKADQLSNFFSYELLIDSDCWLSDSHKLLHIVSAWGTGYRKIYYDADQDKVLSEVLSPEDVIINSNTNSINKCRRITIRNYMTANNIVEFVRAGRFLDIDPKELNPDHESTDDTNPVYEILEQFSYLDLDDDGYEEPYIIFFHKDKEQVLGIYAAYTLEDVHVNESGKIKKIINKPYIADYHCIDDPEGKYHSLGLNHLLFHQNKSITSILRQLVDSGALANQQGGFVTKAFKTKQREVKLELGKFTQLEVPPTTDIRSQIIPLPFKEPSQVLFSLLGLLIEAAKETGFITQALVGDMQGQNVPATTMLAIVEQGTRAFKPMVQKLYHSLKKEFKIMYDLYSKFSNHDRYIRFSDTDITVSKSVFEENDLDIIPVADPTQSSEAHRYMQIQALQQLMQTPLANVINLQGMALRVLNGLQIDKAEELIAQPQPDPKAQEAQMKMQLDQEKIGLEKLKAQREQAKVEYEGIKTQIKQGELQIRRQESDEKQRMMLAKSYKDQQEASVKERLATVAENKVDVERHRLALMAQQQRDKSVS